MSYRYTYIPISSPSRASLPASLSALLIFCEILSCDVTESAPCFPPYCRDGVASLSTSTQCHTFLLVLKACLWLSFNILPSAFSSLFRRPFTPSSRTLRLFLTVSSKSSQLPWISWSPSQDYKLFFFSFRPCTFICSYQSCLIFSGLFP